jgi:NTP pyrophosphatase (non-canonical NTP hydrolase)
MTEGEKAVIREAFRILGDNCYKMAAMNGFWDNSLQNTAQRLLQEEPDLAPETQELLQKVVETPVRNKGEQIGLIMSECGEMLEAVRKPAFDDHCPDFSGEEIEAADVLIRLFDYSCGHGLKLADALIAKYEFNQTRPRKHGKQF